MKDLFDAFDAVASVDVSKLYRNIEKILSVKSNAEFYAVVKSDAYGHGIFLSRYIDKFCDGFCVSKLHEGQALRHMGITKPIMTLLPLGGYGLNFAANYDLSVPCYDLTSAREILLIAKNKKITVNMAVDSGMNRLGFLDENAFEYALKALSENKNVKLFSVYSHLKNSADDSSNAMQLAFFEKFCKIFKRYSDGVSHISASGGLIKGIPSDIVRCGILLYGYKPFDCDFSVEPIMKIIAKPSAVKQFGDGDKCLYDSFVSSGKYGLINYGYADGIFRACDPTRCMDMSYEKINSQGYCTVLEDAQKIAESFGTIPYEILANCTKRIKKIYINDDL